MIAASSLLYVICLSPSYHRLSLYECDKMRITAAHKATGRTILLYLEMAVS